jgi:hypothetical protein
VFARLLLPLNGFPSVATLLACSSHWRSKVDALKKQNNIRFEHSGALPHSLQ